ncbi:MAG: hypothetical protein ACMVY4_08070 [Minwuia sp.]|uniref:hypothetical protein n=1 Tax=Minwuia sp. TaxID=2493630 RepID=UPI003A87A1C7
MLWKILLLIAAIAAVLYGFRYMNRPPSRSASKRGGASPKEAQPDHADGQSVDLVKCPNCGAFIAPGTPCGHCKAG